MSASAESRLPPITGDWVEANQRHLVAAMESIRYLLEREPSAHNAHDPRLEQLDASLEETRAYMAAPPALEVVAERFSLSPFERDLLLACATVELDGGFRAVLANAGTGGGSAALSFGFALARLPGAHWSALSPTGPLRYWRLLEPAREGPLTAAPLQIDERVLHYLTGVRTLDQRVAPHLRGLDDPGPPAPTHVALADSVVEALQRRGPSRRPFVVELVGSDRGGKRAVAGQVAAELGFAVHRLAAADLPAAPADLHALTVLWNREVVLADRALYLDADDAAPAGGATESSPAAGAGAVARLLEGLTGLVFVASREPTRHGARPDISLAVQPPGPEEQSLLWRGLLRACDSEAADAIEQVTAQFRLDLEGLRTAGADVAQALAAPHDEAGAATTLGRRLWDACRRQARPHLDGLAQRIEPAASWQQLVLPTEQLDTLRQVAVHVRHRHQVHQHWGLAADDTRGLGISALFCGGSGTGKTMAAEVLAGELALDLYRIDLSAVVSKYIGESEKNLRRVFDAAEAGGAILLFDEADALFGKRTEVRDSHDRFANIEISYLLQRMEAYRGLAILTTNMKSALDQAFMRRLRFIVEFPFPDAAARERIWRGMFPPRTPTQGLDFAQLALLNVAGGNIRNIALGAAFNAADEGVAVQMRHVAEAARREYRKLERTLQARETRGWA